MIELFNKIKHLKDTYSDIRSDLTEDLNELDKLSKGIDTLSLVSVLILNESIIIVPNGKTNSIFYLVPTVFEEDSVLLGEYSGENKYDIVKKHHTEIFDKILMATNGLYGYDEEGDVL